MLIRHGFSVFTYNSTYTCTYKMSHTLSVFVYCIWFVLRVIALVLVAARVLLLTAHVYFGIVLVLVRVVTRI